MATSRNQAPQLKPNGAIKVSRFVKVDTTQDNSCLQCTLADRPIGISAVGPRDAPGTVGASALAAVGDGLDTDLELFGLGDICLLSAGTGTGWTRGAELMPDADGGGKAATSGNYVGAIGLESTATSEFGRVQVHLYKI